MINQTLRSAEIAGVVFCLPLLAVMSGCLVETPHRGGVATRPPPMPVQRVVVVQDDYVYYPGYEVYYSSNRRQYVYRDGNAWVTRAGPPNVQVEVLFASPSVHLDFHDAPALHHESIVRTYPRNWSPPGRGPAAKPESKDERKDDRKPDKKNERDDDRNDRN